MDCENIRTVLNIIRTLPRKNQRIIDESDVAVVTNDLRIVI